MRKQRGQRVGGQGLVAVGLAGLIGAGPVIARAQTTGGVDGAGSTETLSPVTPGTAVSTPPVLAPVAPGRSMVSNEVQYETVPRYGVMATGGTIFLVSYLATIITNAALSTNGCFPTKADVGCRTAEWPLYIPVAGPFVQMGYLEGDNRNIGRALLAVDGAVQGAGLTLFLIGALARKRVPATQRTIQISAFTPGAGGGIGAFGRF